jgi:hypothetical protein
MTTILFFVALVWNIFASFWNARVVGKTWYEAKAIGGFTYVAAWAGAIMSAVGFTSVYAVLVAILGATFGFLPHTALKLAMDMVFVLIAIPALITGYIITIEAWIIAYREKSLLGAGVATLDTVLSVYNTMSVVNSFPKAWDNIKEHINADSDFDLDSDLAKAIVVAGVVLFGGVLTTVLIMRRYMGTMPLPESVMKAKGLEDR